MRRSRAPSIARDTFFVAQSWADCITNMAGFNLRHAQVSIYISRATQKLYARNTHKPVPDGG